MHQYETGSIKQIKSQILEFTKKWEKNRSLYGPSHYMQYNHNCAGNPNYTRKKKQKICIYVGHSYDDQEERTCFHKLSIK